MSSIHTNVTEPVNFRLNKDMIENLKQIAEHITASQNKEISYVDLIRCVLAYHFPNTANESELQSQRNAAVQICNIIDKKAAQCGLQQISSTFNYSFSSGQTLTVNDSKSVED
jgi:hypothetical protein